MYQALEAIQSSCQGSSKSINAAYIAALELGKMVPIGKSRHHSEVFLVSKL